MKKTVLWSALFTLLTTQVFAEDKPVTATPAPTSAATLAPTEPQTQTPAAAPKQPDTALAPAHADQPADAAPAPTVTAGAAPAVTPANQPVNCDYKIPATTKVIDQSVVLDWSEKATIQAFSLDPTTLDKQFTQLQPCFTEQGWTGFNTALQQSGNLEAIKTQKLRVSSKVDGKVQMTESKINQWKISLPIQVVYQNDKEKVSQLLTVDLTVNRKISGDLGITQIIATPRGAGSAEGEPTPKSN